MISKNKIFNKKAFLIIAAVLLLSCGFSVQNVLAANDYPTLQADIATANSLISANASEGTTPGQHTIGALATLQSAVSAASAVNPTDDPDTIIGPADAALTSAIATYNLAIVPPSNISSLTATIATANALINSASDKTTPAVLTLQAAVSSASAVANSAQPQSVIDNADNALNTAIGTYSSNSNNGNNGNNGNNNNNGGGSVSGSLGGGGGDYMPINGACGSASGLTYTAAPAENLCSAGSASAISGSGPWTWICNSTNGAAPSPTCTANKQTGIVLSAETVAPDSNQELADEIKAKIADLEAQLALLRKNEAVKNITPANVSTSTEENNSQVTEPTEQITPEANPDGQVANPTQPEVSVNPEAGSLPNSGVAGLSTNGSRGFRYFAIALILLIIGYGVYYFTKNKENEGELPPPPVAPR
jgi:uncharacterized membrane protein YgcG